MAMSADAQGCGDRRARAKVPMPSLDALVGVTALTRTRLLERTSARV
jgi:hypothetical protein